jgi:predicted acylesterase/phospholipase RssA
MGTAGAANLPCRKPLACGPTTRAQAILSGLPLGLGMRVAMNSSWTRRAYVRRGLLAAAVGLGLGGCAQLAPRQAVPELAASRAEVQGYSQIRVWGDTAGPALDAILKTEQIRARQLAQQNTVVANSTHDILALSGGADDGAFGAGLLFGWTERGNRPQFSTVTGVSAGALIAPFAFLGPAYDPELCEIYTAYGGERIYRTQLLSGLLGGNALADNAPLAELIAQHVTRDLMRALARERAKGRLLIVGTTNLDAQRPVFWDIGRIAQSGRPDALELIRHILLASAALPGLFPPVRIRVVVDGEAFEEMHVDGGPTRQVFLAPADLSFRDIDRATGTRTTRRLWVIRNSKIAPEYAMTADRTLTISQRSLETLTKYQGLGDLARMYRFAERERISFTSLPSRRLSTPRGRKPSTRRTCRPCLRRAAGSVVPGTSGSPAPHPDHLRAAQPQSQKVTVRRADASV